MLKENSYSINPINFYKRAYYHLTNNEQNLTNLGGLPKFAGKVPYGHYPFQDMSIFVLLHVAHILCALFQIKRTVDFNIGKKIWK